MRCCNDATKWICNEFNLQVSDLRDKKKLDILINVKRGKEYDRVEKLGLKRENVNTTEARCQRPPKKQQREKTECRRLKAVERIDEIVLTFLVILRSYTQDFSWLWDLESRKLLFLFEKFFCTSSLGNGFVKLTRIREATKVCTVLICIIFA